MIHEAELVIGVGIPGPVDLNSGRPDWPLGALRRSAVMKRYCPLNSLYGVEGRVAGEEGYGRVQSATGKQHQWETGTRLSS